MIRILIVDDQKTARESIKSILEKESTFEIVGVAANGQEGIRLAITLAPDIILMDLIMPDLNGLVATQLICQKNSAINVVILTIEDSDDLLIQAINVGAKGYLLKTVPSQEIIDTLKSIYRGSNLLVKHHPSWFEDKFNINGDESIKHHMVANIGEFSKSFIDKSNRKAIEVKALNSDNFLPDLDLGNAQQSPFDLTQLVVVLKRRYSPALIGFVSVLLGAILYLIFTPRLYRASALISLENRQESVSELGRNLSNITGSIEYSPLANQTRLIKSIPILETALDNLIQEQGQELIQVQDMTPQIMRSQLEVRVIPNTNILEVSYANSDPKFATLILNEIIDAVIQKNTDRIRSEASSVRQFLEQEVSEQKKALREIETSENRYREQKGIVALDNQTTNLVNRLNNLETQEQDLLAQIKEQQSRVNTLKKLANVTSAESAYIEGRIGQDSQLERLRTELINIETELADARSKFTDQHSMVISLLEERNEIQNLYQKQVRNLLGEEVAIPSSQIREHAVSSSERGLSQEVFSELIVNQTQLEANREKLDAIQTEKGKTENQIALLPSQVQSLTELVRQREQANESLQFLQRKLEEARIAEAQLVSNIHIVELASVPSSPSSPKASFVLAIATTVGIILATGIILLLETTDRTLYNGTEVERQFHIPFLANLSPLPARTENLEHIQSFLRDEGLYEPYRTLLKRIETNTQKQSTVVVITSTVTEEGKSVVTSHLGAVAALLSRKTLIIDAHLLKPKQHVWFDLELEPGLVEIVADQLSLAQAIQSTAIKNLSVLASGIPISHSSMIMESPVIQAILQQARQQYDLVIIDTPSVNDSCDAYTLGQYSDGLVMVTQPLYTSKTLLKQTLVDLRKNRSSIIGFVTNNRIKRHNEHRLSPQRSHSPLLRYSGDHS